MASTWRLGEELWRGVFRQASTQPVPWESRQGYGALCLGPAGASSSPTLLVLGGFHEDVGLLNDVWRSDDEGRSWELSSKHDAGRREGGNLILRKWIGRSDFATAASWSFKGGRLAALLYVVGGEGPKRKLADVWVSEDLGRTFVRMCSEAPFGARSGAGLAVCPGCPRRLILSGGLTGLDKAEAGIPLMDCWLSMDMGETWAEVPAPEVALRRAPKLHFTGQDSIVLLGGSSITMVGQAWVVARSSCTDAYAAGIDWGRRSLCWRAVQIQDAGGNRELRGLPLRAELVAGGLRSNALVGLCTGGVGATVTPDAAEVHSLAKACDSVRLALVNPTARHLGRLEHLLLPAGGVSLLLLTSRGAYTTRAALPVAAGSRELLGPAAGLRQQLLFITRLGAQLELRGIPSEVWSKVIAHVFHPRALAMPGIPSCRFQWSEAVERVVHQLGDTVRICVLGGPGLETQDFVSAVAAYLDSGLESHVAYITTGTPGLPRVFAENCGDGAQVFNLLPAGQASAYGSGTDIHAGADRSQCQEVFFRLAHICLVFEGGPESAVEVARARDRGALVLHLASTSEAGGGAGGAGSQCPTPVAEQHWALLHDESAAAVQRAGAAVAMVEACAMACETSAQAAARVAWKLGSAVRICLLTEEPEESKAEQLESVAKAVAGALDASLDEGVCFLIAGSTRLDTAFRENCGDGSQVFHLLPLGSASAQGSRHELHAGVDCAQCREVFCRLGDAYLLLGESRQALQELRQAGERGAYLLPVGHAGPPSSDLARPPFVGKEQWELLCSESSAATASAVSAAVAGLVTMRRKERQQAAQVERQAAEEGLRRAREEAERKAREEAESRIREEHERRAREEEALVHVHVVTPTGKPCGTVRACLDNNLAHVRDLVRNVSPFLANKQRFHFMWDTMCLPDDMTLAEAGLHNGSCIIAAEY